jgi:hypothetical protein
MVRQCIRRTWQRKAAHFVVARKQEEKERAKTIIRYTLQEPTTSDLLPPTRTYLLQFPPFPHGL